MPLLHSWRMLAHTAALAISLISATSPVQAETATPPVAAKKPRDVSVHGDRRIDDYFWLREKDDPEVQAHLKAEAAYAEAWFKPHAVAEERLFEEMKGRVQQRDQAVPQRQGRYWYGSRIDVGQQYPVHFRRAAQGPSAWTTRRRPSSCCWISTNWPRRASSST